MILLLAIILSPLPLVILLWPSPMSLREEERLLKEYFRKVDRGERP